MRIISCIFFLMCFSCMNVKEYGQKLIRDQTNARYLNSHNEIREFVGAEPLIWDEDLEKKSRDLIEKHKTNCNVNVFNTDPFSDINVFQSWGSMVSTPREVVHAWGKGQGYQFKNIINRRSIAVGCAFSYCKSNSSSIHVCYYKKKSLLDSVLK